jgi:hypothetical protein
MVPNGIPNWFEYPNDDDDKPVSDIRKRMKDIERKWAEAGMFRSVAKVSDFEQDLRSINWMDDH